MIWPEILVVAFVALGAAGAFAARRARRAPRVPPIDPFAVGEPWRQLVQRAQRSQRQFREIVDSTPEGPLNDRLTTIAAKLGTGVLETWRIAQRGDDIDAAVKRLGPAALQARLQAATADRTEDSRANEDAVAAITSQIDSVERLRTQSSQTLRRLEVAQLRTEELVSRAVEVSVGSADTDAYAHDVDDLLIELEALRLASDETDQL